MEGGNAICVSISFLGNFQPRLFFPSYIKISKSTENIN